MYGSICISTDLTDYSSFECIYNIIYIYLYTYVYIYLYIHVWISLFIHRPNELLFLRACGFRAEQVKALSIYLSIYLYYLSIYNM